jgi:hypothetical protein
MIWLGSQTFVLVLTAAISLRNMRIYKNRNYIMPGRHYQKRKDLRNTVNSVTGGIGLQRNFDE